VLLAMVKRRWQKACVEIFIVDDKAGGALCVGVAVKRAMGLCAVLISSMKS